MLPDELILAAATERVDDCLLGVFRGFFLSGRSDGGGLGGPAVISFAIHGGRFWEGLLQLDGTSTGAEVGGAPFDS